MRSNRFLATAAVAIGTACSDPQDDLRTVAELDTAYQAAVERNDARAMEGVEIGGVEACSSTARANLL